MGSNATPNSLVLMDEIGRGTSTYDGLSLAWASAEWLANQINAMTLFATHYFELTELPNQLPTLANVHLDAVEHGDSIAFMHAVQEGAASKSYGLAVAGLAGVPKAVIKNARAKLTQLEALSIEYPTSKPSGVDIANQLSLIPEPSEAIRRRSAGLGRSIPRCRRIRSDDMGSRCRRASAVAARNAASSSAGVLPTAARARAA